MDDLILPECFLDTNMAETLVPPVKSYNHQKGCHTVAKVMQEKLNDSFALGILDNDKSQVVYLADFTQVTKQHDVLLFKHPVKHHFLILHPPMESWLINQAEECQLDIASYDLPTDLKNLSRITKVASSKNDHRFKRLFRDLIQRDAIGLTVLKKWLSYLKQFSYKANTELLQTL